MDLPGGLIINPFKVYATEKNNRVFHAYSQHTENLKIYSPGGNTSVSFAIDVAWPGHCTEPYEIGNFHQETLLDDPGATASIWVEVFDWQNNVSSVSLFCPQITAETLVYFTQVDTTEFQLELVNIAGAVAGEYSGVIIANSSGIPLYDFVPIIVSVDYNTIGLIQNDPGSFDGYTLFRQMTYPTSYLIDMDGNLVHSWEADDEAGMVVYLLENGNLLYNVEHDSGPGPTGGRIEEIDWDGNIVWEYEVPVGTYRTHHDIERLPNGNTLLIAYEYKPEQECIDAGRDPDTIADGQLAPDAIIEIEPTGPASGNVVWEWHAWDHMSSEIGGFANGQPVSTDITDPGKLDINFSINGSKDWLHLNAVDYNPEYDQIILSSLHFRELFIIDHSTADYSDPQSGIDAARGPAGDIIYRWGNPQAYGAGDKFDKKFFGQHDTHWIEPGLPGESNILVFNNGGQRNYSSVEEIVPPVDEFGNYDLTPGEAFDPVEQSWIYTAETPEDFYSGNKSGTQRLPNGNTLICATQTGWFFEITPDEQVVWQYICPVNSGGPQQQGTLVNNNSVFRSYRYSAEYPGLAGRDLMPGDPIELPRE